MSTKFIIEQDNEFKVEALNTVGTSFDKSLNGLPALDDTNSIYFSQTGDDTTGDGTQANPYKTIQEALANITATKTNLVSLDSWTEDLTSPLILSGDVTGIYSAAGEVYSLSVEANELPDGFVTALSDIDRKIYGSYDGILYAGAGTTNIENIYTFDGSTWTLSQTITEENIQVIKPTSQGLYLGTDGGKIIRYTDASTYSTVYDFGNDDIKDIVEYNGYIFAISVDVATGNKVLRSADGTTFTELVSNLEDAEFGDEDSKSLCVFEDRLTLCMDHNLCASTDGETWNIEHAFTYSGTLGKCIVYKDTLYIIITGYGLLKIESIEDFAYTVIFQKSLTDININTHLYVTDNNFNLYRSVDGLEFTLIKSSIGSYIGNYKDELYIDDNVIHSHLIKAETDISVRNMKLLTDCLDFAIYTNDTVNLDIKYLDTSGFITGVINTANNLNLENAYIKNTYNGIKATNDITIKQSIFTSLDGTAIKTENANDIIIDHITISDVYTGLHIEGTLNTYDIKNSIIYYCHYYGITSEPFIYLENCNIARADTDNADFIDCLTVNPLFLSEQDLRLKTKEPYADLENGYALESPCKQAGTDNADIGAYIFNRIITKETELITIQPKAQPLSIDTETFKPYFQAEQSLSGAKILNSLPKRRRLIYDYSSQVYAPDIENLIYLLSNKSFYIVEDGFKFSGTGTLQSKKLENAYARFELAEAGNTFKVLTDKSAKYKLGALTGYILEVGTYKERILFNTETDIYISSSSDIPEGTYSYRVEKVRVVLAQESLKATRLIRKHDRHVKFNLIFEESDL